jgi:LCP family protein required for cell wall assembly
MTPTDANQSQHVLISRIKRRILGNVILARTLIIVFSLVIISLFSVLFIKPVRGFLNRLLHGPRLMTTFFSDPLYTLPNYNGRTNILFLGMGGMGHDGGMLTDTMIFTSLNLKTGSATMISIPRDIWVRSITAKINAAYEIGEKRATGSGTLMAADAVYEIVGEPIHYTVLMDFAGFEQLIDSMGGIDVMVDKPFTDELYPIKGKENDLCDGDLEYKCRYETLVFSKGLQHMNGNMALKFARSRHSADLEEGTDFARAARQQKVIAAIKAKALSPSVLLNPRRIMEARDVISGYVTVIPTLTDEQYSALAGFGYSFWRQSKEVQTLNLDMGDEENPGFLVNPPLEKYDQWILESRWGDWKEFQRYLAQKLDE